MPGFSRQISGLGRTGDVAVAITTSGNSANVCRGIDAAHDAGANVILLTGANGGDALSRLRPDDVSFCVPSSRTARIQEIHGFIIHCLCEVADAAATTGNGT